ncbi:putative Myb transcription factor [Sclerotinia borealis F-4128]|uniref:Putative Myb transcription factor n=1 Tax=Sclerotinia borealis (strain F-4128) TaxID=1432307 RepID=W9C7F2_SCLBF|nr:putative Myb transcription factor [Sclerotinia borealis F-4128]
MPRTPRRWAPQEDSILLEKSMQLCLENGGSEANISWTSVADALTTRTNKDCRKRWFKLRGGKRGPWRVNEDHRLQEGVQKHGSRWILVAETVKTRNSDQCAKRWQHCLDPSLDHSEWTNEEDIQLVAAVTCFGTSWKDIKKVVFPRRSTANLKNRHTALIRQNNESPKVPHTEDGVVDPSLRWMSFDQDMFDDDGQFGITFDESSHITHPTSFASGDRSGLSYESPKFLGMDMISTSANTNSDLPPLNWDFTSDPNIASSLVSCGLMSDHTLDSRLDYSNHAHSALWKDRDGSADSSESYPMSKLVSPSSEQVTPDISQILTEEEPRQVSNHMLPTPVNKRSSSMPQMVIIIDEPNPQIIMSMVEILTRTNCKASMSMKT